MKTIFNNIKAIFNINTKKKALVNCNYANNYYGDQYCQVKRPT
ncbi:MAG: hypothetical protein OCD00_10395 [Colwellia sp.]